MASDLQREQQKYRHNLGMLTMARQNLISINKEYPNIYLHDAVARITISILDLKAEYAHRKAKIIEKRGYGVKP